MFLLLIETDRSPGSGHVCEALSEPRRVLELDDSDLIGDHDIRYFYVVLCRAALCYNTLCCYHVVLCHVILCQVLFFFCFDDQLLPHSFSFLLSAISCGSRHTALLSAHSTRIIIMLVYLLFILSYFLHSLTSPLPSAFSLLPSFFYLFVLLCCRIFFFSPRNSFPYPPDLS